MTGFRFREKIAVGAILIAFVFFLSQVAVYLGLFGLGLSGVRPRAVPGPGPEANLLKQGGVELAVSSYNEARQRAGALIDGNPRSYWHISLSEVGRPAEVTADFGEGNRVAVRSVSALPRQDLPVQFLRRAELAGSDDGRSWRTVARIVHPDPPEEAGWRRWDLDNDRAYRFWRLRITEGHEDGSRRHFYSLAELKFE